MKKLFFTLLTLCLCGATYAQTTITDSNGWTYTVTSEEGATDLTVELTTGTGASGEIEIPATVQYEGATYTVVGIAGDAFGDIYNPNTSITGVTIPYTVKYLGNTTDWTDGCFSDNTNLTSVTIIDTEENPSQLETIGCATFEYTGITSIDIPESVTAIGPYAFEGCTSLTEVKLPEGLTSLGADAFANCSNLVTVWMPGSLTLNFYLFGNCTSLGNIVLEGGPGENGGTEDTLVFSGDGGEDITLYVETGLAPEYLASAWADDFEDTDETLHWNFNSISILSDSNDSDNVYYATYYTDAVGEFGEDVAPCIVTDVEDSAVTYSSISGYIPAETGLLLVASNYNALNSGDTYYYHPYGVTDNDATADVSSNMLLGTNEEGGITTVGPETGVNYYFYELALDASETAGTIGFYWGAEEGGAFTSAAGKAYLAVPVSDGSSPASLHFNKNDEGDTTGISAVENASEKAVSGIYTIQGVRVSNMNQPGLYIVDGKKVLVK